jgi:hypothetical protein
MFVSAVTYKGGVDKAAAASHLAAYLQTLVHTFLLAGDDNRNATAWSQCGRGFSVKVADEVQADRSTRDFTHTMLDTGQRSQWVDLQALSDECDPLIIPIVPASLDMDVGLTPLALQDIGNERYRRCQHRSRGREVACCRARTKGGRRKGE